MRPAVTICPAYGSLFDIGPPHDDWTPSETPSRTGLPVRLDHEVLGGSRSGRDRGAGQGP
ncbi:hypothetical protein Asera_42980 [Actinocatenispora sera]|uniref:Uncharacterized protein n=1 Tax=Actinocatenispora sera TaxID=390989 RepID=A0A810L3Q7_9ACTN|nr:hypothetical protein Asera_42980 [Actinocatenispora sera]